LLPGDIILTGSDGRDDIQIGTDSSGSRIINEDENLFLRHVEAGAGDVHRIADVIRSAGQLTDDFTLMSFEFRPETPLSFLPGTADGRKAEEAVNQARASYEAGNMNGALSILRTAREKSGPHPDVLKEVVRLYIKDKKYSAAVEAAARYSYELPADMDLLYMTAYAAKFAGAVEKGIDFAERLRLRDPENPRNMMNLSELYMHAGNYAKALRILEECTACGGSPELAGRLRERIEAAAEKEKAVI
jgi:tetratricopeptide (TPR) repeat protein